MTSQIDPKRAVAVHVAITALIAVPFFLNGATQYGWNSLFGGVIAGLNLAIIAWTVSRIIQKKSIALATAVIVIKYAILFGLLYTLVRNGWRIDFGFVAGLATLFPTLAYVTYKSALNNHTV